MDGIWILVSTPHLGPQVNPEDATPNDENSLERAIGSNVNPPPPLELKGNICTVP